MTLYFVERDFGKLGTGFLELDRLTNSRQRVIDDIRDGQLEREKVLRILEVDEDEGTCRNVTCDILEAAQ